MGVDGISAVYYKYGCNELLSALQLLFNTILSYVEYPSRWATGKIYTEYGVRSTVCVRLLKLSNVAPGS